MNNKVVVNAASLLCHSSMDGVQRYNDKKLITFCAIITYRKLSVKAVNSDKKMHS
jgi:hypothetical protein